MYELAQAAFAAGNRVKLKDAGYEVEQTTDFELVRSVLATLGKPYLTPALDPCLNDFTAASCFWLIIRRDGEVVAAGGARLDDLTGDSISDFWQRSFARYYSGGVSEISHEAAHAMSGRICYLGDLFIAPGARGKLELLTQAVGLCLALVNLKWSPDYTYAFLKGRDVMRGAAQRYGFTVAYPASKKFEEIPPGRSNDEYCAVLSRSAYLSMIKRAENS